jgi:hypothetical protein
MMRKFVDLAGGKGVEIRLVPGVEDNRVRLMMEVIEPADEISCIFCVEREKKEKERPKGRILRP